MLYGNPSRDYAVKEVPFFLFGLFFFFLVFPQSRFRLTRGVGKGGECEK